MNNSLVKYYSIDIFIAILAVITGYFIGGFTAAWTVAVLSVLEISLSFDNAVVNATVLQNWGEKWRRRFLTWGILIAVFGMRLIFPLLIVGVIASLGPIEVFKLAVNQPDVYAQTLKSVHHEIAAFGGAFLLMVFLKFFLDSNKDEHWLHWLEAPLAKIGKLDMVELAIAIAIILGVSIFLDPALQHGFVMAGACGLITYILASSIGTLVGGEESEDGTPRIIKEGIGGFMYLEILDASFSFDGVVGAFALTTNIFIIMLGLGVGALFVRSMTVHLVEKGTLNQFKFLEHGAFWAIGALAAIMFAGTITHIPEVITGLIGATMIGLAIWSSVRHNKKEAALS